MTENIPELISVIMPCHNAVKYLRRSVASVLDQNYHSLELVVVDDGSTDDSLGILQGVHDRRLKIISGPNRGVCAARNLGLAEATGDYVAFLDADDTWRPDCLEMLWEALQRNPHAALAYCGWQNVGLSGARGRPFVPPDYERPDKVETLFEGCRWPIHAALTRREAIVEAGGFDERFATSEDYYLWLRIATRYSIERVPVVLAYYHFHQGLRSKRDRARAALDHWRVQREFLRERPDIPVQLGHRRRRKLTHGVLLEKGYVCYWDRDVVAARKIFRQILKSAYGNLHDWKYMLPALLPLAWHHALIRIFERDVDGR